MAEEYEVLFDWEPENADDLRLFAGETLEVLQKNEHGWWYGMADRSGSLHKGYFPKNYVKPIVIVPDAPKPPPRPARSMEPPVETKLVENVAKMSVEHRGPSFSLKTCHAFDDLMELGYAVELEDISKSVAGDLIERGFHVELNCVAKIWDGASTVTKEFATGTMAFVVGKNQVISGLDAALQKLKVGQKATVTCSPALAYGAAGNPPSVPPNSFVVFTVEVLSASPPGAAAAPGSSSSGTSMLLGGSGVTNTRKVVKGNTENRRDSRLILVPVDGASSGCNTPQQQEGSTGKPSAAADSSSSNPTTTTTITGVTATTTTLTGGPSSSSSITPPKPAKPTPVASASASASATPAASPAPTPGSSSTAKVGGTPLNSANDPGSPESLSLNNNLHDDA